MKNTLSFFIVLFGFTLLSCNSSGANTPEELATKIVEAIKTNNEVKFISYFGSFDDYYQDLLDRDVPQQEEDRMLKELEARKDKYAKIPKQSYNEIINFLKQQNIDPSSLVIEDINVKTNNPLGREKAKIIIRFKQQKFTLYMPECVQYKRGFLSLDKTQIEE